MRKYHDLHEHLGALEDSGLLVRVDRPINKDTELHPLVRWQFRGGVPEKERKAFLFENVVDSKGNRYDMPVTVAALAGSSDIYAIGMGCNRIEEINARWDRALKNPVLPKTVDRAVCQEVVISRDELASRGLGCLPVPISTPGFDNAPYTTCSHWLTEHPITGARNVGNYRGQLKSNTRVGIYVLDYKDFWHHWEAAKELGNPLDAALVIGAPPFVSYAAVQPVPYGTDELSIAGGLAGESIEIIKCKTVDLHVPAQAEIVIEGRIPTDAMEPEGPFGESYGYVQLKNMMPFMDVSCITHRRDAVYVSFISQVTPSESSKIKEVGYEPILLSHLRDECSIPSVVRVAMHEPLANLRPYIVIQFKQPDQSDVWRAMYAILGRYGDIGKIIVAVDEDIDPKDPESVNWALCYRMQPDTDVEIVQGRRNSSKWKILIPDEHRKKPTLSSLLINATLKTALPPISLPSREYMENARTIWEDLGLHPLTPRKPWHGYSLGEWPEELAEEAQLAAQGDYFKTGGKIAAQRTEV